MLIELLKVGEFILVETPQGTSSKTSLLLGVIILLVGGIWVEVLFIFCHKKCKTTCHLGEEANNSMFFSKKIFTKIQKNPKNGQKNPKNGQKNPKNSQKYK